MDSAIELYRSAWEKGHAPAAAALGLEAVHALALPGKVAPVTAGAILRDTICNMLREAGFLSRRASG